MTRKSSVGMDALGRIRNEEKPLAGFQPARLELNPESMDHLVDFARKRPLTL
jgi:hypothetical protein